MKLRQLLFLVLPLIPGGIMAYDSQITELVVLSKDGSKTTLLLNDRPVVTFSATDLNIKSAKIELSYPIDDFQNITYGNGNDGSGLSEIGEDINGTITNNGEYLSFDGLLIGTNICVYSLNGLLVHEKRITGNSDRISLGAFPAGTYIVKANGLTCKIMKK